MDNQLFGVNVWTLVINAGLVIAGLVAFNMVVAPIYGVWAAHKQGQADLARSQNEQMIQVAEAQGRLNAAELNKQAAIVEAEAVAAQIKAIGENLTKHDLYLRWQWINMMEKSEARRETIYVPTEANLPVLEAGRSRS